MAISLFDVTILTPERSIASGAVVIDDEGRISYLGSAAEAPQVAGERLSLPDHLVVPGFIDIHTHGGQGLTFDQLFAPATGTTEPGEALQAYAAWAASAGVTGFLCSIAAPDTAALKALVKHYVELLSSEKFTAAQPLGLHLEGPYLNPRRKGAFNPEWLRSPLVEEVRELLDVGQGWIRQMTLAPELPDADKVTDLLQAEGVVPAMGHTDAEYETAAAALRDNFAHVTHTFNAQRGFHHREPGALGAVLTSDEVTAELIADTIHVHPAAMKLMVRALGTDRIVLVTDAMAAAGLGDGSYTLVGEPVEVRNGVAREADGTIAGSTATMDVCVRHMVQAVDVPIQQAVQMATRNPARVLGMEDRLGLLDEGLEARLAVLNADLEPVLTVVGKHIAYRTV